MRKVKIEMDVTILLDHSAIEWTIELVTCNSLHVILHVTQDYVVRIHIRQLHSVTVVCSTHFHSEWFPLHLHEHITQKRKKRERQTKNREILLLRKHWRHLLKTGTVVSNIKTIKQTSNKTFRVNAKTFDIAFKCMIFDMFGIHIAQCTWISSKCTEMFSAMPIY